MLKNFGTIYRPIIPAGQPLTQDIAARHFYYVNGAVPIRVKFDRAGDCILRPGQGVSADVGDNFSRLEISTIDGTAQAISFWAGFVQFIDNRQDQIEARTECVPIATSAAWDGTQMDSYSTIELPGTPTETLYRRRAVVVSNLDPSAVIELRDGSNVVTGIVRPGETITHNVSGPVFIGNNTGAAVPATISEIWWTL